MAGGKYYAFMRRSEIEYTPMFTNNLQVLLSVFAFSSFIVSILWWCMGRLSMLKDLHPIIFHPMAGFMVVHLFCFGFLLLYSLIKLIWAGFWGQIIHYNPKTILPDVLSATKPLENDKDLKEYRNILKRLIDEKNELINEYQAVIKQLEVKGGSKNKPSR